MNRDHPRRGPGGPRRDPEPRFRDVRREGPTRPAALPADIPVSRLRRLDSQPAATVETGPAPRIREIALCGYNAVSAAFRRRPESVLRLFFDERSAPRTGEWTRSLAAARRPYRMVESAELAKVADSVHHGGIVAIVEEHEVPPADERELARWAADGVGIVALDGIGNPHNLGFLARSAAFFGYAAILVAARSGEAPLRHVPAASYRVADGGLEHLAVRTVADLPGLIRRQRASFLWCCNDPRGETALDGFDLRRIKRAPALVIGNEEQGVSAASLAACEHRLAIRGRGAVESLNVSAAAAVMLHHFAPLARRLSP